MTWKAYDEKKEDLLYYEVIYDNSSIKNYTVYYQNGGKLAEGGTYGYIEKNTIIIFLFVFWHIFIFAN